MFKLLPELSAEPATVRVTIDGRALTARAGDSVAATLLAAGVTHCRTTPVSGAARAPYCMMGVCFDCLVVVDGVGNRQGCMVRVQDGMRIEIQRGKRELGS
jgi:predicted molibdopterin-dependent oxidoreductase YjgC